jgi:hypothetical protein
MTADNTSGDTIKKYQITNNSPDEIKIYFKNTEFIINDGTLT